MKIQPCYGLKEVCKTARLSSYIISSLTLSCICIGGIPYAEASVIQEASCVHKKPSKQAKDPGTVIAWVLQTMDNKKMKLIVKTKKIGSDGKPGTIISETTFFDENKFCTRSIGSSTNKRIAVTGISKFLPTNFRIPHKKCSKADDILNGDTFLSLKMKDQKKYASYTTQEWTMVYAKNKFASISHDSTLLCTVKYPEAAPGSVLELEPMSSFNRGDRSPVNNLSDEDPTYEIKVPEIGDVKPTATSLPIGGIPAVQVPKSSDAYEPDCATPLEMVTPPPLSEDDEEEEECKKD